MQKFPVDAYDQLCTVYIANLLTYDQFREFQRARFLGGRSVRGMGFCGHSEVENFDAVHDLLPRLENREISGWLYVFIF